MSSAEIKTSTNNSSDLITYKIRYVPNGQGFINLGATCYFNSLLQCLLSCPVIYEVLNANREKEYIRRNRLAQNMIILWETALRGDAIYDKCVPVWRDIIAIAQAQNNRVRMDNGQQDAHEGLMMFLDAMETIPEVRRLFEHKYRTQILCDKCQKFVVDKKETNLVFEAQPDLKNEQLEKFKDVDEYYNTSVPLNEFLRKQNGFVDENYMCPECKEKRAMFRTTTLTMVPEILPVVLKKYYQKTTTPFPAKIEFLAKGGSKKYVYKLVAQSEHAGTMAGGHYWAICARQDGWKILNDSSVGDQSPGPTSNTYVLFYNFIGEEDVQSS